MDKTFMHKKRNKLKDRKMDLVRKRLRVTDIVQRIAIFFYFIYLTVIFILSIQ